MRAAQFAEGLAGVAERLSTLDKSVKPLVNRRAVFSYIQKILKAHNMTGINFHLSGTQNEFLAKLFHDSCDSLDLDFLRKLHGKLILGQSLVSQCLARSCPELSANLLVRNILVLCNIEKWVQLPSAHALFEALKVRVAHALSDPTPTTPPPATP